jgi:hypothetical protein
VLLWQLERIRDYLEDAEDRDLLNSIMAGVKRLAGPDCNTELEELLKAEHRAY